MHPRTSAGILVTAVTLAVSFLTVCVPGVAGAHAVGSGSSPVPSPTTWAYGAIRSISPHGQGLRYGYDASATLGFAVILGQTDSGTGNYSVTVNRTMGLLLTANYCAPNCRRPTVKVSVSYHEWESLHADLNFTPEATVDLSGTPTAALGLANSHLGVDVGLNASATWVDAGELVGSRALTVQVDGNSSTAFTPALGLVPLSVAPGDAWTATSAFLETGSASWKIADTGAGKLAIPVTGNVSVNGSLPFAHAGTVSVTGAYSSAVRLAGSDFDALNLTIAGPFLLREGFLLVPASSDLFGATTPGWLSNNTNGAAGNASVSQASIDVTASLLAGSHLGFGASGLLWRTGASNPATAAVLAPGAGLGPAAGPVAPAAAATNSTYVQGEPESVGQATTDQQCLANGVGCPVAPGPRGLLGLLVVAGAAAVVAVLVAVVIAERRRVPPAVYPNASLYPPGAPAAPSTPLGGRHPERPAPPPEDDPLHHLW